MKSREAVQAEVAILARNLISFYKWRAVNQAILVERVMEWIDAGVPTEGKYALERLCEQASGEQLHKACARGVHQEGVERMLSDEEEKQLQWAYADLENYLIAAAYRLRRPIVPGTTREELVQETLITVHAKLQKQIDPLEKQIDPRSLFSWAVATLEYKRLESWRAWNARNRRIRPLNDDRPESNNLVADKPKPERGRSYESVDPERDEKFSRILDECLHNEQERQLVLGYMLDLKRQDMLLKYSMPEGKFDYTRRALKERLQQCCRFLVLFDLAESPPQGCEKVCKAPRCPLRRGRRS